MKINIRILYLYLFSFVGLLIVVIGSIRLLDLGLKTFVFPDADKYEYSSPMVLDESGVKTETLTKEEIEERQNREQRRQKEREFTGALSMVLIGLPLYFYHWKTIQKEAKETT